MTTTFQPSQSIAHVINRLDEIIRVCKSERLRQGYFAALYKHMTIAVQQAIIQKKFEDNERMERLDVIFADRYLLAWQKFRHCENSSLSWTKAFEAGEKNNLVVFQHLLLGVNTHINFDLSIAAAQTCPGPGIRHLKHDFELINQIIASLTSKMQSRLCRICWPMYFIRDIMNGSDDAVIEFSIVKARKASWIEAMALAQTPPELSAKCISVLDDTVSCIADRIITPGRATSMLLAPIKLAESSNIPKIITLLEA